MKVAVIGAGYFGDDRTPRNGPDRLRRDGGRYRRRQGGQTPVGVGAVLRAGTESIVKDGLGAGRSGSPGPTPRRPTSPMCTFSWSEHRRTARSERRPIPPDAAIDALCPHLEPAGAHRRQVDGPGGQWPNGWPSGPAGSLLSATAWSWPGTPSSCGRASRSRNVASDRIASSRKSAGLAGRSVPWRWVYALVVDRDTPFW